MKKVKSTLSILLTFLLIFAIVGCADNQAVIYDDYIKSNSEISSEINKTQSDNETLSGELTLSIPSIAEGSGYAGTWTYIIDEFNKVYPNIKIVLRGPETLQNESDYVSRMTVELMSGEAGDIVDLSFLPYINYSESGVFIPLDSYFENKNDYPIDSYFTNVFDAIRYKNQLYCLPYEFSFFSIRLNRPIVNQLDYDIDNMEWINTNTLLEMYFAAKNLDSTPNPFYIQSYTDWSPLSIFEYSSHINEESKVASFESEEFIEYLKTIKKMDKPEQSGGFFGVGDLNRIDDDALCFFTSPQISHVGDMEQYIRNIDSDKVTDFISIESGTGSRLFRANLVAVTSNCKNPDLAWVFIKYLLNNELKLEQDNLTASYNPIRKTTMEKLLNIRFGVEQQYIINKIYNWCEGVNTLDMSVTNFNLWMQLNAICTEYINDLISAEECAKRMQERAYIYLKE